MSDTTEHLDTETEVETHTPDDTESRARRMGWKPPEELRVQPRNGALSAEEFLARGENDLPILRERLRSQDTQLVDMSKKLDQATDVITKMNDRFRTVEDRAYQRARKELDAERTAAIASADVQEVRRLDKEINDLDKTAPKAEPDRPQAPQQGINPDAAAWLADGNDWFTKHPDLAAEAQALHIGYQQTHRHLSTRQNLDKVTDTIRKLYPDRFENQRRAAPAAVTPSSAGVGARRVDPRSFDALPADAKREFERYSKSLSGKGKPLTKEEWATYYHEGD
jgi:hypothetical protein